MRLTSAFLSPILALALVVAAGCGDDDDTPGTPDSAVAAYDADPNAPDAAPGQPDGTPGQPDATPGQPDAGTGEPPEFTITLAASCPGFTPCGGDITGTWFYTGVCVEHSEILGLAATVCPSATVVSGGGTGHGQVVATGTTIAREVTATVSGTLHFPQTCVNTLGGGTCAGLQTTLQAGMAGITCVDATGNACDCSASFDQGATSSGTYTITGNVLTTTDPAHTYDICVDGTTLSYKDTTLSFDREFGVATLAKQ